MRDTSREAWRQIRDSGVLGKRRWECFNALFNLGPCTARELGEGHGYWKRLSELRDMGAVREVGKRPCKVTGQNVIVWDVTSYVPTEQYKPRKRACAECAAKQVRIDALEAALALGEQREVRLMG